MRKQKVLEAAREVVDEGRKPSATVLADKLEYSLTDVHRCLNILEREKRVRTYRKNVLGQDHRLVGVKRE